MSKDKSEYLDFTFKRAEKKLALLTLAMKARERGEILLALALIAAECDMHANVFTTIEKEALAAID